MKTPLIEKCPCCEVGLFTRYAGMEEGAVNYQPFCWTDVNLPIEYILAYRCTRCGAEWEHGQFGGDDEG